jgi:hypothetical protein
MTSDTLYYVLQKLLIVAHRNQYEWLHNVHLKLEDFGLLG